MAMNTIRCHRSRCRGRIQAVGYKLHTRPQQLLRQHQTGLRSQWLKMMVGRVEQVHLVLLLLWLLRL